MAIPRKTRAVRGSARVTRAGDGVRALADLLCAALALTATVVSRKVRFGATHEPAPEMDGLSGIRACAQIDGVTLVCNDGKLL